MYIKKKSFIGFIVGLIFVFLFSFVFSSSIQASAESVEKEEQKVNCQATVEDEFADDSILIVLTNKESRKDKTYTPKDFSEVDCLSVTDLTAGMGGILKKQKEAEKTGNWEHLKEHKKKNMLIAEETFNRILCLKLKETGKQNVLDGIEKLEKRKEILSVEPNYQIQGAALPGEDYNEANQWALTQTNGIQADKAWDIVTGSNQVTVAVIDSGIDATHPALANRIYQPTQGGGLGNLGTSSPLNHQKFGDGVSGTALTDENGHGTHVAGIIGAQWLGENTATGVCWNIQLLSLKVLKSNGIGENSSFILAISYAHYWGVPIINFSISSWVAYSEVQQQALENYSGLVVCSAGNEGKTIENATNKYPAIYDFDNQIVVGSTNSNGAKASDSNYGQYVDIYAPGVNILSTWKFGIYYTNSGTSMATPHVTGVAALLKSLNPNLTPAQIKAAILNNADIDENFVVPGTTEGTTITQTVKKLNAFKAVASVAFTTNTSGNTITGTILENAWSNVTIPDSINGVTITGIASSAFENKSTVSSITLPNTITFVGQNAFHGTTWYENQGDGLVYLGNVLYTYKGVMAANTNITNISSTTTLIAEKAFYERTGLKQVTIPQGVKYINASAFNACTNLEGVTFLGSALTNIGASAFNGCTNLVALFLEGNSVVGTGTSLSSVFGSSYNTIKGIYVKSNLVYSYQINTTWRSLGERIYPLNNWILISEPNPSVSGLENITEDYNVVQYTFSATSVAGKVNEINELVRLHKAAGVIIYVTDTDDNDLLLDDLNLTVPHVFVGDYTEGYELSFSVYPSDFEKIVVTQDLYSMGYNIAKEYSAALTEQGGRTMVNRFKTTYGCPVMTTPEFAGNECFRLGLYDGFGRVPTLISTPEETSEFISDNGSSFDYWLFVLDGNSASLYDEVITEETLSTTDLFFFCRGEAAVTFAQTKGSSNIYRIEDKVNVLEQIVLNGTSYDALVAVMENWIFDDAAYTDTDNADCRWNGCNDWEEYLTESRDILVEQVVVAVISE